MSTELTVIQRAEIALESSATSKHLAELAASTKAIVAITNKAGRQECHAAAMTAADARISIQRTAKAAREDAQAFSKAVIAEEKRLIEIIEPEEQRLKVLRDEYDARIEAERAAKANAERQRIAAIHERISAIRFVPQLCAGQPSAHIRLSIHATEAIVIDESFAEFAIEAEAVKREALDKLNVMCIEKEAAEADDIRIAAEKAAEEERMKAEREALKAIRAELEKKKRKDEKKLWKERMEIERQKSEIQAENARLAEQQKAQEAERRKEDEWCAASEDTIRRLIMAQVADELLREQMAGLIMPTLEQVTQLVADHFAGGDYPTAQRWLDELFQQQTREMK